MSDQLREEQRPVGRELVGAADGVEHAAGQREAQLQRVGRRLVLPRVPRAAPAPAALRLARVRQVVRQLRVDRAQQALLWRWTMLETLSSVTLVIVTAYTNHCMYEQVTLCNERMYER